MLARRFVALILAVSAAGASLAAEPPGFRSVRSAQSFDALVSRVEDAVRRNGLAVLFTASASRGAAARGVKIPGNAVVMAFRNDYAVRLLGASTAAGIEAPLRLYVTENADGTASLSYRSPSAVFAPYGDDEALRGIAAELDGVFEAIARDAVGK
jgi:uncharacterized protein (DUF302 family)